jgi:hypothetical protein
MQSHQEGITYRKARKMSSQILGTLLKVIELGEVVAKEQSLQAPCSSTCFLWNLAAVIHVKWLNGHPSVQHQCPPNHPHHNEMF